MIKRQTYKKYSTDLDVKYEQGGLLSQSLFQNAFRQPRSKHTKQALLNIVKQLKQKNEEQYVLCGLMKELVHNKDNNSVYNAFYS